MSAISHYFPLFPSSGERGGALGSRHSGSGEMYPKKVPWATAYNTHHASAARSQDPPHLSPYPKERDG